MPGAVSVGRPEKKASKAASPPAEAPMPMIGKDISGVPSARADGSGTMPGSDFAMNVGVAAVSADVARRSGFFWSLFLPAIWRSFPD